MLSFYNIEALQPYKERNGYVFRREDGMLEDVWLHFNFHQISSDIVCGHLIGREICCRLLLANNVRCYNLIAEKIEARNIEYYALCLAYSGFNCISAKGKRKNAIHACLDKEIEYGEVGK